MEISNSGYQNQTYYSLAQNGSIQNTAQIDQGQLPLNGSDSSSQNGTDNNKNQSVIITLGAGPKIADLHLPGQTNGNSASGSGTNNTTDNTASSAANTNNAASTSGGGSPAAGQNNAASPNGGAAGQSQATGNSASTSGGNGTGQTGNGSNATGNTATGSNGSTTNNPQVQQQVQRLKTREEDVKTHEMAHESVGGQYAGAPTYTYTKGPDGKEYISGGEVSIDMSPAKDPAATARKMRQIEAAALAPADPSPQDRSIASEASQIEAQAQQEANQEALHKNSGGTSAQGTGQSGGTSQQSGTTLGGGTNQQSGIAIGGGASQQSIIGQTGINAQLIGNIQNIGTIQNSGSGSSSNYTGMPIVVTQDNVQAASTSSASTLMMGASAYANAAYGSIGSTNLQSNQQVSAMDSQPILQNMTLPRNGIGDYRKIQGAGTFGNTVSSGRVSIYA